MGNSQGKPVDTSGAVNLNHFKLLRVVGRGAFGKVRIVERKDTGLSFALKYIRKDEVVRSESVRNIIRERRMLEHVNHPFICNLRYSFQDIEYMYLIVDLMSGGDLRFHISRKAFTEEAVRFWIAELGCALQYVHSQGIVHRDIKPDNVLLDADGHVHLTDFNVASDLQPGKSLTSKSGTLAYLAPEVYTGQGYDRRADWWSLGVLFYECIYNKRPFEGNSELSLSTVIKAASPRYPVTNPPVSLPCLYAIKEALEIRPSKRMGSTWESFTQHEFFQSIDFVALERKEIEPIFVPSSEKTNFDATYDLEELLLEEAPLEARARRQKPRERLRSDATEKEIREDELYKMMERDFRPFDYTVAAYKKIMAGSGSTASNNSIGLSRSASSLGLDANASGSMSAGPGPISTTSQLSIVQESYPPAAPSRTNTSSTISTRAGVQRTDSSPNARPAALPPYPSTYSTSTTRSGRRTLAIGSATGGVQVTLEPGGSWSDLARKDATLPADAANAAIDGGKACDTTAGGVFGFLNRKKGRGHSPKPKERGVLGKEGARVVVG